MGFLSSIKKLFGFGNENVEIEEVSSTDLIQESEPLMVEEVKSESFESPVHTEVETVEEPKVEVAKVEEPTTVKEIKSKARKPQTNSQEAKSSEEKPKKPYRRPRPKKNKPTE